MTWQSFDGFIFAQSKPQPILIMKTKSITITVESDEEMNRVKALMLSMDISFKVEEKNNSSDVPVEESI